MQLYYSKCNVQFHSSCKLLRHYPKDGVNDSRETLLTAYETAWRRNRTQYPIAHRSVPFPHADSCRTCHNVPSSALYDNDNALLPPSGPEWAEQVYSRHRMPTGGLSWRPPCTWRQAGTSQSNLACLTCKLHTKAFPFFKTFSLEHPVSSVTHPRTSIH
jgi:hypothetical protein